MAIQGEQQQPGIGNARDAFTETIGGEKRAAADTFGEVRQDLTQKATELASDAKEAATHKVEQTQRDISANLGAIGGALRAAGEHLAGDDQRLASGLMLQAAGGLERLSSSLKNQQIGDVLEEVRTLGRNNSGALFAGSLLAGLALGRLLKSSSPENADGGQQERDPEEGAGRFAYGDVPAASDPDGMPPSTYDDTAGSPL